VSWSLVYSKYAVKDAKKLSAAGQKPCRLQVLTLSFSKSSNLPLYTKNAIHSESTFSKFERFSLYEILHKLSDAEY
jgi:hypothetical protein